MFEFWNSTSLKLWILTRVENITCLHTSRELFFFQIIYCFLIVIVESIRKNMISNYKNIIEEMQFSIARDIRSKCIGNVSAMDDVLQGKGKRRERMNKFMEFVLQEDYNVLAFEKVLVNSGLKKLLNFETSDDVEMDGDEIKQEIGKLALFIFLKLPIFTLYISQFFS